MNAKPEYQSQKSTGTLQKHECRLAGETGRRLKSVGWTVANGCVLFTVTLEVHSVAITACVGAFPAFGVRQCGLSTRSAATERTLRL